MSIEFLRKYCVTFPGVAEDIKWKSNLCFCVADKMFCITDLEGPFRVSFKCTEEDFFSLIEREGISPAPYLARSKWVMVGSENGLSKKEWEFFVRKSYDLIVERLPKKTKVKLLVGGKGR